MLVMMVCHSWTHGKCRRRQGPLALWLGLIILAVSPACISDDQKQQAADSAAAVDSYALSREAMVRSQLIGRGISDTLVLNAMRHVPRHRFVPERWRKYAHDDSPLPIGEDQTISQPYIVALMTELLTADTTYKVLEVGTGSGYQAAILAEIVDSVFTIEIVPVLARRATAILDSLNYGNVIVKEGDGYRGWAEHAPFDAIIVTCAPDNVPAPLVEQLRDGGTMVIPVGDKSYQELIVLRKSGGRVQRESVAPVRFVPMTGEAEKARDSQ